MSKDGAYPWKLIYFGMFGLIISSCKMKKVIQISIFLFSNLDVEVPVWFDALEPFYRPWKIAYFQLFSNVPLKRPARRKKYTSNMAATIGDVMDDITCKSSRG
jgi:hypothetical protein